ncbi:PP2C family protein-serine/threonine phosphatase [Thermogemmatispora sp.]|uniref:PP2C family protein-serine/threonine phosphatase n=1 Tax=Thermogemmatispora sp. TaxID=1968838 RepID=UPI001D8157D7|nr:protein phosphatase 2C domain-containing protein [Thermogemmatispora sp.]MBX5449765.1 serine/threonine-protein phosphatase [Thermogemmatispora sp.]
MLGQFNIGYGVRRLPLLVRALGWLCALAVLVWVSQGFPPHAWLLFWQTLQQLPALWTLRGPALLLPLLGLAVFALLLAGAWIGLLLAGWRLLRAAWRNWEERRLLRHELEQLREAEAQATHAVMGQRPTGRKPSSAWSPAAFSAPRQDSCAPASSQLSSSHEPSSSGPKGPSLSPASLQRALWADFPTQVDLPLSTSSTLSALVTAPAEDQLAFPSEEQTLPVETPLPNGLAQALTAVSGSERRGEVPPDSRPRGMLVIRMGAATDPGLKRRYKPNEDNLAAIQQQRAHTGQTFGLCVVADGMGGHSNGREASRLVVETFCELTLPALTNSVENDESFLTGILVDALQHANLKLYQRNRLEKADMGTTVTAALLLDSTAYVLNVGDSRTYLYRPATGLTQVTQDHSVVARLLDEGAISQEDVYHHPHRNQIYRCLGDRAAVEIDVFAVPLLRGDKLLLCSDGLWEMVRDPQIEHLLGLDADPMTICQCLIQAALDGGGDDNVSVIVVEVLQVAA